MAATGLTASYAARKVMYIRHLSAIMSGSISYSTSRRVTSFIYIGRVLIFLRPEYLVFPDSYDMKSPNTYQNCGQSRPHYGNKHSRAAPSRIRVASTAASMKYTHKPNNILLPSYSVEVIARLKYENAKGQIKMPKLALIKVKDFRLLCVEEIR